MQHLSIPSQSRHTTPPHPQSHIIGSGRSGGASGCGVVAAAAAAAAASRRRPFLPSPVGRPSPPAPAPPAYNKMASPEYWLLTVPNRGDAVEVTLNKMARGTANARAEAPQNPHRVDVPNLVVGTLDSLMALSDDLSKVDFQIEGLVKRVERQYHDLEGGKKGGDELKVAGQPVDRYIANFNWEHAKYPQRRTLPELVALVQAGTGKIEEELKALSAAYQEKQQAVQAGRRKKGGSLITAPLEEVLTEEHVKGKEFVDTEFLLTLVVVVPRNLELEWISSYHTLGADIAAYNNPDWASGGAAEAAGNVKSAERGKRKGSPVVPGSTQKLFEDSEACLYTVTILKGQYESGFFQGEEFQPGVFVDYVEAFKAAVREKRFVARNFSFDPAAADNAKKAQERAIIDQQQTLAQLIKWCKAHYGEAMTAWLHVKVIRTFVEAVLRYGLPVDYTTVITRPKAKKEKSLQSALDNLYGDLAAEPNVGKGGGDIPEDKEGEETPYVLNKFNPLAGAS